MISLHGKVTHIGGAQIKSGPIALTKNPNLPTPLARKFALISDDPVVSQDYQAVFRKKVASNAVISEYILPEELHHLSDGDFISINPSNQFTRVLYRTESKQNSILLTEQCNHYCLMCSQPPKRVDDRWLLEETKQLIRMLPNSTPELGFTGGEPTLYGQDFIDLMSLIKNYLPNTSIHILTNGRSFNDIEFTRAYANIGHQDMMLGIPIYSDDPVRHDYVVQASGAFDETIRGILNLKSLKQKVEIRIVLHKQTIDRLTNLCEFIARNLLFVDHVALMGLEMIGFTRANIEKLWIDPHEYRDTLSAATLLLKSYGINVSIYNHQRCLINDDVVFANRKSISDWKNEYVPECNGCLKVAECGGFFTSGMLFKYSDHITPYK
jgi:His-Xaa-Ser system radical SAM maturase HxsC